MVTTRIEYTSPDGVTQSDHSYDGARMASLDPVGTPRRDDARAQRRAGSSIRCSTGPPGASGLHTRRNMLHEDEVFAARLALAGPWVTCL